MRNVGIEQVENGYIVRVSEKEDVYDDYINISTQVSYNFSQLIDLLKGIFIPNAKVSSQPLQAPRGNSGAGEECFHSGFPRESVQDRNDALSGMGEGFQPSLFQEFIQPTNSND